MLPKNTKSFALGYALAVNAQQQAKGETMQPSIVILGASGPCIISGTETLRELKTAIEFALDTTED